MAGSLLLQGYFAIWNPSSFGLFAEFPAILLFAICISTVTFLVMVAPIHIWIRRTHRGISPSIGFIVGLGLGCLAMMGFTALSGWPMRVGELLSGSIAGAVGVVVYVRLIYRRGAKEQPRANQACPPRFPILLVMLTFALPLQGADQLTFVRFGPYGNVIAEQTSIEPPPKVDEKSLERRINRLLCKVGDFFTRPVRLPKGYYLKESYGVVSLHDRQGKKILDENAAHFSVKEPYVAVWGINSVYFLNTETGEITSVPVQYYTPLPRGGGGICIKDFITFWDINTGYKPVTWSQK
ncbi:MAG: hypothetical protein WCK20_07710 [Thermoleophilia bacterium]